MPERTTVTEVNQIGIEVTSGTSVAANRLFQALSWTIGPSLVSNVVETAGNKFSTGIQVGKDWTAGKITGMPSYNELVYLFNNFLITGAITGAGPYTHTFSPAGTSEDTAKSFTLESGSSVLAQKATYVKITDLSIKGSPTSISVDGAYIGAQFTTGVTLTASPTAILQIPVNPPEVSVWIDTTSAGLGTTKLTRVLSWEINLKNRYSPLWVVDAAVSSFSAMLEQRVDFTVKLRLEADATGIAQLTAYRGGNATRFMRIGATSVTSPYAFTLDHAVKVKSISELGDTDGVYAFDVEYQAVWDPTWGKVLNYIVTNSLATL